MKLLQRAHFAGNQFRRGLASSEGRQQDSIAGFAGQSHMAALFVGAAVLTGFAFIGRNAQ